MKKTASALIACGILLVILSSGILTLTFYPVILGEINYRLQRPPTNVSVQTQALGLESGKNVIYPVDEQFGIVITKIGANAKVIPSVDPYDSDEYQRALTKGVAHAEGTAFPGEEGNIFIFSHSSANFFEATRYNSVFYLLNKMDKGDEIVLVYQKKLYRYIVTDKKIVAASEVSSLEGKASQPTLTLMTCWPPGTTLERLLVIAKPVDSQS